MGQEPSRLQKLFEPHPKLQISICMVLTGAMAIVAYPMVNGFSAFTRVNKEYEYKISHLDRNAVSPDYASVVGWQTGSVDFLSYASKMKWEDTDKDGDYDSILVRRNSDGKSVDIPVMKGLEGKIEFPSLSATAVNPLNIPKTPHGLIVDYIDIDGDDKLESIIYVGLDLKNAQRIKMEQIKGKYVFTSI